MVDLLIIISAACIYSGIRKKYIFNSMKKWKKIDAIIYFFKKESEKVLETEFSSRVYYYPNIKYSYHYDNVKYESSRVGESIKSIWVPEYDENCIPIDKNKLFWSDWQVGKNISIFVNPNHPGQSMIKKPFSKNSLNLKYNNIVIVSGLLFLILWYFLRF